MALRTDKMNSRIFLFVMLTAPFGILFAAQGATTSVEPIGRSCTDHKLVAFGYTHKQIALAEMAAIVMWQDEATKKTPGFSDWHLAKKRTMKCRQYKKSMHYQCVLSATPCRMDRTAAAYLAH